MLLMKTSEKLLSKLMLVVIITFNGVILFAQRPGREMPVQKEKIEAHKIAFLTDQLQLTPAEAEKFWPVYNANRDKIENERQQFRKAHDFTPEDIEKLSDEEANKFLNDQLDQEQKMLTYPKEFNEQLKDILPPQKILMLFEAEQEFKIQLMKRIAGRDGPPR